MNPKMHELTFKCRVLEDENLELKNKDIFKLVIIN